MSIRINLLFDDETARAIQKVQTFMREKKQTQTIRWLIESSLIYIEEGQPSPILKLLHENKDKIRCQAEPMSQNQSA